MSNSKQKPVESRDFNAAATIQFLTDLSPILIVTTTFISLLVIFFIDITHLAKVFFVQMSYLGYFVAFLIPLGIMIARLAFGLLGAKDISGGAWLSGILGLAGTFAIAIFEHYTLTHIAKLWEMYDQIGLFQFIVWLAVGAELRLMMTLGNENNLLNKLFGAKKEEAQNQKPRIEVSGAFIDSDASGNGNQHQVPPNPDWNEERNYNLNYQKNPA